MNGNNQLKSLIDLKDSGVKYLSKWQLLDIPSKLETIKNNQLYAGYSSGFNDVFDAQIRISDSNIQRLHQELLKTQRVMPVVSQLMSVVDSSTYFIEEMRKMILRLSSANLTCFSSNDALSFESSNMWGLYGNSGAGIALQYSIDEIIDKIDKCPSYKYADIFQVNYRSNYAQEMADLFLKAFERMIPESLGDKPREDDTTEIVNYSIDFITTKDTQWQHEKEYRLVIPNIYCNADSRTLKEIQDGFNEYKKDHSRCKFDFIKPAKIILGWNESNRNDWEKFAYKELEKWAFEQNIECIFLSEFVDYDDGKFETK